MITNEAILEAVRNTLLLAVTSSVISTMLGTIAAYGINKMRSPGVRTTLMTVTQIPMINPEIIHTEGEQTGPEGCLSVPGKYGLVKRPYFVKVRAQDRHGNWFEAEGEELIARCFCHELDHLEGVVYTQVMERYLTDEELMTDEE